MYGSYTRHIIEQRRQTIENARIKGRYAAEQGEPRTPPEALPEGLVRSWLVGYDSFSPTEVK